MTGQALAFMVLIGGFVWGGFLLLLVRALRREAGKASPPDGGAAGS